MNLKAGSSSRVREAILVLMGGVALTGAILASKDLFHAIQQAEAFYSIGMKALSVEGDLQDYTQESRRVFVYALTSRDPNIQLPYVKASQNADKEVNRLYREISAVALNPASKREIAGFDKDWNRYVKARNSIAGLILEDQPALAMERERSEGAALFEICARRLKSLKRSLDQNAEQQLVAVRQTYYRCAAEVGFLLITTLLFIFSLRMLSGLKRSNQHLEESERAERGRSKVLKAISQNVPLDRILRLIADLVEQKYPLALCAITIFENTTLPSCAADTHVIGRMKTKWTVPIWGSSQGNVGTLDLYFAQPGLAMPEDLRLLERKAQLAALAVEHDRVSTQLAFQAQHDGLTSLVNGTVLQERLSAVIARASAERRPFALLWIDLDRFKQVNDNLGHQVGDLLLQNVARRLTSCVGETDTVARMGGDEFVILLGRCESAERAIEVAARIVARLNEPVQARHHSISLSASLGIGLFPEHGRDPETILRNADTAMYTAKSNGKNMFQLYDPKMGVLSSETFEIDRQLKLAMTGGGEFELHYQPQVGGDGRIECVEALLRWNSPTLGPVSPARFVPIAEENGVIVALGAWVLQQACAQASIWRRKGYHLRAAVNVSPHQFVRSDFPAAVARALADNQLPPEFLELELTETAVVRNLEDIVSQFEKIRQFGVRISIDDFGTGNSSLSYLRALPVDGLKIDRSFVAGIEFADRNTLPLVRAIIGMAHGLSLRVVAEGTETLGQLQILRREGCDLHQGYFLYRPVNVAGIDAILKAYTGGHPAFVHEPDTEDLVALSRVGVRAVSDEMTAA